MRNDEGEEDGNCEELMREKEGGGDVDGDTFWRDVKPNIFCSDAPSPHCRLDTLLISSRSVFIGFGSREKRYFILV